MSKFGDFLKGAANSWVDVTKNVPVLGSLVESIDSKVKANKIKPNRPTYEIPKSILGNLDVAQALANRSRIAGQNIYEDQMAQNQAASIQQAQNVGGSSQDILDLIAKTTQAGQDSLNTLALKGAEQNQFNQQNLMNQNQIYADYLDKTFQFNKVEPYMTDVARKQALEAKSIQDRQNFKKELVGAAKIAAQKGLI